MHCAKRMSESEIVMHPSHSHSFVLRNACREPVPRVITFLYDTLGYACSQNAICRLRTEQRGNYVVAHRGYEVDRLAGDALGHGRL